MLQLFEEVISRLLTRIKVFPAVQALRIRNESSRIKLLGEKQWDIKLKNKNIV